MATNFMVKLTDFDDLYVIRRLSMRWCAYCGFCWYRSPFSGPKARNPQKGAWV